jgi:hypothetical protein
MRPKVCVYVSCYFEHGRSATGFTGFLEGNASRDAQFFEESEGSVGMNPLKTDFTGETRDRKGSHLISFVCESFTSPR